MGKKKGGKQDVDDDEYAVAEETAVAESQPAQDTGKTAKKKDKKQKKQAKGGKAVDSDEDDVIDPIAAAAKGKAARGDSESEEEKPQKKGNAKAAFGALGDEDDYGEVEKRQPAKPQPVAGGKGKKGGKARVVDDDEYELEPSSAPKAEEKPAVPAPSAGSKGKKGKKGKKGRGDDDDDDDDFALSKEEAEKEPPAPAHTKKGKPEKKKAVDLQAAFKLLEEAEEQEEEEEEEEAEEEEEGKEEEEEEEEEEDVRLKVAKITKVEKIPKADKLRICQVDVGGGKPVQVVCGAPNVRVGMLVIFAPIGAIVPATGDRIKPAKLRGVDSYGMLCSAKEMGWADEADGLFELHAPHSAGDDAPLEEPQGEQKKGDEAEEEEPVTFEGKKKSKKKKEAGGKEASSEADVSLDGSEVPSSAAAASSATASAGGEPAGEEEATSGKDKGGKKGKKKGKKGGAAAEDEDDEIAAILAALDKKGTEPAPAVAAAAKPAELAKEVAAAPPAAAAPAEPAVLAEPAVPAPAAGAGAEGGEEEEGEGEAGDATSAASKAKKKKQKAKEKAKAKQQEEGAAEAKPVEDKKPVSAAVRAMQEKLAKMKEAEERAKREEEERRRKEEEEEARRIAEEKEKEEKKRLKKLKEKEKIAQKKREGKLLTGKQKEEAKRLAAMREQMLRNAGVVPGQEDGEAESVPAAPKRPIYGKKRVRKGKQGPGGAEGGDGQEGEDKEEDEAAGGDAAEEAAAAAEDSAAATPVVEEEAKTAEEPAPAAAPVEEEDDAEDDWEALDEKEVKVPQLKKKVEEEEEVKKEEKVAATKKPAAPADKAAAAAAAAPTAASPTKPAAAAKKATPAKPAAKGPASKKAAAKESSSSDSDSSDSDSDSDSGSDDSSDDSDSDDEAAKRKQEAKARREARVNEAMAARSADDLRSPICCILGHVDTGKTKLLDRIRNTNVQEGEAGGITQQIGATYFPREAIAERTEKLNKGGKAELKVPGLLIIDTPGHESFTNLRSRGSSLCDIAILVVDIMHGLEPQTLESINLLKMRKTPFVIALNKVDRIYDWKAIENGPIRESLKMQKKHCAVEFENRVTQVLIQFAEQGLNAALYWKNTDIRKNLSVVPTSAITGEGIPDMLLLLVQLTQKMMTERLMYIRELQCTVLEVKVMEGLGTTIDVVLVNGELHEGDQIVVCGLQGPIVTTIRALLTPHPMKELRVKGSYLHHKSLKAAVGIKITAQNLESAVAGTQLYRVDPGDDIEVVKEEAMKDMEGILSRVDTSGHGVCVQASTLGSLEALLEFLKSDAVKIPVSGINIGPVHKKDVMRASTMIDRKMKEYAVILAFDVKITPEARDMAEELGVRIFTADIIYHLFDQFTAYMKNIAETKKRDSVEDVVFPCVLKILPTCVFNKRDPIVVGVEVEQGTARIGTPLCIPSKEGIEIGRIASMEVNHKAVQTARKGEAVAMKIQSGNPEEAQKQYGRHFDHEDALVSKISRKSIDILKESYKDEMTKEDWLLIVKLKKVFEIQ